MSSGPPQTIRRQGNFKDDVEERLEMQGQVDGLRARLRALALNGVDVLNNIPTRRISMMLPKGTIVAVSDGEKFNMFRNAGDEAAVKLVALPHDGIAANHGTSTGRQASSANPDHGQAGEDQFSAGIVQYLNQQALGSQIDNVVIVAAPRALGEMRQHYHKALSAILLGEIAKDLTGHSIADVEKALAAA